MSDNENIFPNAAKLLTKVELTALEEAAIIFARETATENKMFFDTATALLMIETIRYINGSNKLRRSDGNI